MDVDVATVLASLVLAPVIALVVHELAHALAAFSLRATAVRIQWGTTARVIADLPDITRARVAFFAAGAVANVVVGVACIAVGKAFAPPIGSSIAIVGAVNVLFALVCACGSDGREVVRSIRNDDRGSVR